MLLIARRYLLSTKSHSVVNIIAGVSLVSLLLPVAAVIVLLSVFNGFGSMVDDVEGAVEGDLTVRLREGKLFDVSDIDRAEILAIEGVESLSFITELTTLLKVGEKSAVVTLRGVDKSYTSTLPIEETITFGGFEIFDDEHPSIVVGGAMASQLGVRRLNTTTVKIYALRTGRLQSVIGTGNSISTDAELRGVVSLDNDYELHYAYTSQSLANELVGREDVASRIAIRCAPSDRVRRQIETIVGEKFRVESRAELNPAIHQMIHYEKRGVLLICIFVMILASFSLLGAMTMLIIEKRGDVKTLRAMGATRGDIKRIFMLEGGLIGGVAVAAGSIVGVVVTLAQQHFGLLKLPSNSPILTPYPVVLQVTDILVVIIIALLISMGITSLVVGAMSRSGMGEQK